MSRLEPIIQTLRIKIIILLPLLVISLVCFSQTKKKGNSSKNINYQVGSNNVNNQTTINIFKPESAAKKLEKINTNLSKSTQLTSFISRKNKKNKILILPFYFRGNPSMKPVEKFEEKLFAALSELINKDTLDVDIAKLDDYVANTTYSKDSLFKLKATSKINLIIFGSYDRTDNGDIVNCNWLSDSINTHLPSVFPGIDTVTYRNSMVSVLFNEQYNLIDYKKNKSITAPLFITFFSLGVKIPFHSNQKIADFYFNKALQFASNKNDTLAIYRFKIFTDKNPTRQLFYCNTILSENPNDSLVLYYKYRALIEKKLYKDALVTVYDLSKFKNSDVGMYILDLAGIYRDRSEFDSCMYLLREGIRLSYIEKPIKGNRNMEIDYNRSVRSRKTCIQYAMKIFYQKQEYDSVLKYYNMIISDLELNEEHVAEMKAAKERYPNYFISRIADNILYPVGMSLIKKGFFKEGEEYLNIFLNDYSTIFDRFYLDPITRTRLEDPWFFLGKHYKSINDFKRADELINQSLIFLRKRVWNENVDLKKEILEREDALNSMRGKY